MGTNYYMLTRNKKIKDKYFNLYDDYELTDVPKFGYEIHIYKKSGGWKTLFQSHDNAYKSVEELEQFIRKHQKSFIFYDEYLEMYSPEEFIEKMKYQDRDKNGNIYKKYGTDEPLINHKEYYEQHRWEYPYMDIKYWQDKDGYDFTEGDFS